MPNGLEYIGYRRLVIYDASEFGRSVGAGSVWTRAKRWATSRILGASWALGSRAFFGLGRYDLVVPATSWIQVADLLSTMALAEKVDEIQFWGHGTPGAPIINGEPLWRHALSPEHPLHVVMEAFRDVTHPDSVLWWRSCSVFAGNRGIRYAQQVANFIGCRHAGHTHIIGFPWHSGLHTVGPSEGPMWSPDEGDGADTGRKWSNPAANHTILFWTTKIPKGW